MELINWDDQDITDDEISSVVSSLKEGVGAKGKNIPEVEDKIRERLGCNHAILVSNCTTALLASLMVMKKLEKEL